MLVLSTFFNVLLHNVVPQIETVMSVVGVAYMLYLALKILLSRSHSEDPQVEKYNRFFTGVLLQFINPKAILYTITVVSTFVLPYHSGSVMLLIYAVLLAVIGFLGTTSWSVFGSIFQKWLAKYQQPFNSIMALLLVYSAVTIVLR